MAIWNRNVWLCWLAVLEANKFKVLYSGDMKNRVLTPKVDQYTWNVAGSNATSCFATGTGMACMVWKVKCYRNYSLLPFICFLGTKLPELSWSVTWETGRGRCIVWAWEWNPCFFSSGRHAEHQSWDPKVLMWALRLGWFGCPKDDQRKRTFDHAHICCSPANLFVQLLCMAVSFIYDSLSRGLATS